MQTFRLFILIPLAISTLFPEISLAQPTIISVTHLLPKDPIILNGQSGGSLSSKCGHIRPSPNFVLVIPEPLPYLRLTIQSQGNPTLLVDGPGGRFCLLTDNYTHDKPEFSGYWPAGKYSLYVGESSKKQYSYTLSVSLHKKNSDSN